MKLFLLASFLLAGSFALAMPAIGDYAEYDVTIVQSGTTFTGTMSWELTAYDATTQIYTRHTIMNLNTGLQVTDDPVSVNDLFDTATITDALANCVANYQGTMVILTTAAGTYNTCSVAVTAPNETGNDWVAQVPFGQVKFTVNNTDGDSTVATLRSVTKTN